jgi:hypothetical protein
VVCGSVRVDKVREPRVEGQHEELRGWGR